MLSLLLGLLVEFIIINGQSTNYTFAFGNTQGDYMVLQQQPWRAKIWGTSPTAASTIVIQLMFQSNSQLIEKITVNADSNGLWSTYFNPRTASYMEYKITAMMGTTTISLQHILYGDVYICSGQSNMQFTVDQAFNNTAEVKDANNYPLIRVFTATEIGSPKPQIELLEIEEKWSVASNLSIGGGNWSYMSAMCWFFGKNMYNYLNYPIGLIGTDYGGTPVRFWSSPDALAKCNETYVAEAEKRSDSDSKSVAKQTKNDLLANDYKYYSNDSNIELSDSQLWNAMIYPFLQSTIRGAIWYQGEADSNPTYAAPYACQFPAMIADWRLKWSLYSDTSNDFPFGYVQLSTWEDTKNNKTCGNDLNCTDVAIVRWAQSGNYGYVPNKLMPNTFMATAVDLGDPTSPFGDVHPRYKQQVAERLTTAGKAIMYGESELYWQGPIANVASLSGNNVLINFRNVGNRGLTIKNSNGWELYNSADKSWVTVTSAITTNGDFIVAIPIPSSITNADDVDQVRYNWFQAPCSPTSGPYNCGVYDAQYGLPATPFIIDIS